MRHSLVLGSIVAVVVAVEARAEAKQVHFVGMHPIAQEYGGGFCYIEGPHVHIYEPVKADVLYRQEPDGYYFVGDPVPHGYDGPKQAYYGPHPIPVSATVHVDNYGDDYCFLEGPHYHYYAPIAVTAPQFKMKAGVYFYTGEMPPVYVQARPRFTRINAYYKPMRYARPVMVVAPPPEYRGPVMVEEPVVVVPAQATVVGPSVQAGVSVQVGLPPPPVIRAGVGVSIGAPVQPVVIVPSGVIVEERVKYKKVKHHDHDNDDDDHEHGHHDNGWHRGGRH